MPNTRTITIEVPDYTPVVTSVADRIAACKSETSQLKTQNVSCLDSIEAQLAAYISNVCLPLRDVPIHSSVRTHGQATRFAISRNTDGVYISCALRSRSAILGEEWDVVHLSVRFPTGEVAHRIALGNYNWGWHEGIGYERRRGGADGVYVDRITGPAYISANLLPILIKDWPLFKLNILQWIDAEINDSLAAYERDLANERRLAESIASFTI